MSLARTADDLPSGDYCGVSAKHLRLHALFFDMSVHFGETLDELISEFRLGDGDRKRFLKHRRLLRSVDGCRFTLLIGRLSNDVGDVALRDAGLSSDSISRPLTAHGLAGALAVTGGQVGKLNTRIRNIGLAAEYFKLICRRSINATTVELTGTKLLTDLMIRIAERHEEALLNFNQWAATWSPAAEIEGERHG